VHCIELRQPARRAALATGLLCCLAWPGVVLADDRVPPAAKAALPPPAATAALDPPAAASAPPKPAAAPALPAPGAARDWAEFKLQAAQRLMAANPDMTYTGPVIDPLLAIPVLEMDLDREGRVRNIRIVRVPTQAEDTTQLAIEAVQRAAPYGDMKHLPKPWKWVEIFLFDEDRRFKPRTLDN
jgi:hypothetical protein